MSKRFLVLLIREYSLKRVIVQTQRKVKGDDSTVPETDTPPAEPSETTETQPPKDLEKQDLAS